MEASRAPANRVSVGDVVGETFRIYRENAGALLGSAVAVFVIVGLLSAILQNVGGVVLVLLAGLIRLAGHALYTGFVVKLVQDVRDGKRDETVGDLFEAARPAIFPLIGFGILFAIGVGVGFVFLIVPGLILLTFWAVGAPAIVAEGVGPIDAFGRSWRLVRGEAWSVFTTLLVVLLIVIAIGVVLGVIATPIGDGEVATYIAAIVSSVITAPIFSLAITVMYFNLGGGAAGASPPAAAPAGDGPSSVD